jgi:uncharacterized protein (TIGR02246 family)
MLMAGSNDEAAVRALVAKYVQAREARNSEALLCLFTEDADQLVSSGEWRYGRESLLSGMSRSSEQSPGERSIFVERVRFVTPNVAIADSRYLIKGQTGVLERRMWSTFIALRTPDGWRLTGIRNMLPAPSR